jgi:hypothetical protein
MATIRLDAFSDETIVLHFGGPEGTIDAYTLANALIGFADTAYDITKTNADFHRTFYQQNPSSPQQAPKIFQIGRESRSGPKDQFPLRLQAFNYVEESRCSNED